MTSTMCRGEHYYVQGHFDIWSLELNHQLHMAGLMEEDLFMLN